MIAMRQNPEWGWNILFAASLIVAAMALWTGVIEPSQTQATAIGSETKKITETTEKAKQKTADELRLLQQKTWDVGVDALGSSVLEYVAGISDKSGVQMTGFRSERTVDVAGLIEAPFVVVVEGGFPDVLAFEQKLESSDSRLAVNLVQLSASDAGAGRITATLGLVGFKTKEEG